MMIMMKYSILRTKNLIVIIMLFQRAKIKQISIPFKLKSRDSLTLIFFFFCGWGGGHNLQTTALDTPTSCRLVS